MINIRCNIAISLLKTIIPVPIILCIRAGWHSLALILLLCMTVIYCFEKPTDVRNRYSMTAHLSSASDQIFMLSIYTFMSMYNFIPKSLTVMIVVRELLLVVLSIIHMLKYTSELERCPRIRKWNTLLQLILLYIIVIEQLFTISSSMLRNTTCWAIVISSVYTLFADIRQLYRTSLAQKNRTETK